MAPATEKKTNAMFLVPSLKRAGAETQVVELVNCISAEKIKKLLVSFEKPVDQEGKLNRQEVDYLRCERTRKLDLNLGRRLADIIDERRIDVVHCTLQIALFFGWLGWRGSSRRPGLIVAVHSTANQSVKADLIDRILVAIAMRACDHVVFVCRAQEKIWTKRFPALGQKSIVIYNGVDTDYFQPDNTESGQLRRQLGIDSNAGVIACVARFSAVKGHSDLIDAFARIPGQPVLILAGDGELRPAIESDVATRGLADRVHFLGVVADVRPVLEAADVAVLPSVSETFSMAMLEAFAMQVPVVGSDVGGMSEAVIPGSTGELVPPSDPRRLGAVLDRLLGDRERLATMGKACRELVRKRFSRATMVNETESLIANLAATRARAAEGA